MILGKNLKRTQVLYMSKISFHEFNQFLLENLKEQYPDIEIFVREGGDYVWDFVYELILDEGESRLKYKPYDLYEKAEKLGNYGDVIEEFLNGLK